MTQAPATRPVSPGAGAPTTTPAGPSPRPATAPTSSAAASGVSTRGTRGRDLATSVFEGTPGRLRLLGAVAALLAAVFGLVGSSALWSASGALERADHNTNQVVRVQGIYADLVRADADATNAFLAGGTQTSALDTDYGDSLGRVAVDIAAGAQAQPADGTALGALNQQVQSYAATVEQARAYNRQGLPIGATYLSNASATLRSSALPILDNLIGANKARAEAEFASSSNSSMLLLSGLVSLLAIVFVMFWVAKHSHRYVNSALLVGGVLVLAALLVGSLTLSDVGTKVATVQKGDFATTTALATARLQAFDAKSNESLTLIARGSGAAYEKTWQDRSTAVRTEIGRQTGEPWATLNTDWTAYLTAHQAIRALDDSGQWDKAVTAATAGPDVKGSSNATFTTFTTTLDTSLTTARANTDAALLGPVGRTNAAGWALLVLCIGAALLVARGVGRRVDEYR